MAMAKFENVYKCRLCGEMFTNSGTDSEIKAWKGTLHEIMRASGLDTPCSTPEVTPTMFEMRWHPVTKCDEHPKNNKPYIVSIKWASDSGKINAENAFAKYDAYEDCWILDDGDGTVFNADCDSYYSPLMNASITHWMEQPEDPEKTEEGDPE